MQHTTASLKFAKTTTPTHLKITEYIMYMKDKNTYNLKEYSLVPNTFIYSFRSFWSL
jgi:hypothetical protein